jgi:hypothetical protein
MSPQTAAGSQRIHNIFSFTGALNKKKKIGGKGIQIQDLLSRVASIAFIFGHLWCFDTKNIAMSLIVISHMSSAIHVYRVGRDIEARDCDLKHGGMLTKDVPIILRDTIASFTTSNRHELKRTVDEGIKMDDVEPFSEWAKVVAERIVIRCIGWANQMSICGQTRACNVPCPWYWIQ